MTDDLLGLLRIPARTHFDCASLRRFRRFLFHAIIIFVVVVVVALFRLLFRLFLVRLFSLGVLSF